MARYPRILSALLIVGLTVLFAPLLFAAGKGLLAPSDDNARYAQAYRLLEAYRAYDPPQVVLASADWDGDIYVCGYRREQLFSEGDDLPREGETTPWTPYGGLWELMMWRSKRWREAIDGLLEDGLRARTSGFSSEFLRICMRQSLLAPLCAQRVRAMLVDAGWTGGSAAPAGRRIDESRHNRTICVYLDGVAARRGQQLPARAERGTRE